MKRIQFDSDFQKSRSYAPAVITEGGRIVWLAGLLAIKNEEGESLSSNFVAQVRCIFRKMARQMENVGGQLGNIVTMTVFITDVKYNNEFVELRKEFFSEGQYPASTLVTVKALNHPEALVEITATAVMD